MKTISLVSDNTYYNLYTLSEYTQGTTLVVHNRTSDVIFLAHSETQPSFNTLLCEYVDSGQTVVIHSNGSPVWIAGSTGPVIVQAITEKLIAPFEVNNLPNNAFTLDEELHRRLRVDVGNAGFFTGKEFRTFREFSIASGTSLVIRANVVVNTILLEQGLELDAGSLRITTYLGGTDNGGFTTALPIVAKNFMTSVPQPPYAAQNRLYTGGVYNNNGTVVDIHRTVVSTATAAQATIGGSLGLERGLSPNTFYIRLENFGTGSATGTVFLIWEERP